MGSLLYAAALFLMTYGAARLPEKVAVIMVSCGALALIAFAFQERRAAHPIFDLRLFRQNRLFTFSSLAALIHYAATFGVTFLISLYLQYIHGMSAQTAGFALMAQPMIQAVFSPVAGRLSDRIEPRLLASTGMAITALALVQFVFLDAHTAIGRVVVTLLFLGFGFALFSSPNMNAIMGAVPPRHYGVASGVVATMRLLGQNVSMATATVTFAFLLGDAAITPETHPAFLRSLTIIFSCFVGLCGIGIFFSMVRGSARREGA